MQYTPTIAEFFIGVAARKSERVREIENTPGRRAREIAKNFWNFSPPRYYSPLGATFNKNNCRKEEEKERG